MARKPKQSNLDKLKQMKDNLGGDMPWMAQCTAGDKQALDVLVESITEHKDAGPDGDWSCFRFTGKVNDGEAQELEVPFWAMSGFITVVIDRDDQKENGWLDLEYTRMIGDKGRNQAVFE